MSALDVSIQAQVLNLLKSLQKELGLTYLFIAHNLGVVEHISDRVAVMYLGRVAELTNREQLYRDARHPYTMALMSAIPVPDPTLRRKRIILTGDVPSPVDPPSGCNFHPRCWLRHHLGAPEVCAAEVPPCVDPSPDDGEEQLVACHFREIERHGAGAGHADRGRRQLRRPGDARSVNPDRPGIGRVDEEGGAAWPASRREVPGQRRSGRDAVHTTFSGRRRLHSAQE